MKYNNRISAILLIVLGILCIALRASAVSIAMTLLGAFLLIGGIQNVIRGLRSHGIAGIASGAFVILFGWLVVNLALYVLGAILIAHGVIVIVNAGKIATRGTGALFRTYARPAASVIAGILLIANPGGAVGWMFIVVGILLIAEGTMQLAG